MMYTEEKKPGGKGFYTLEDVVDGMGFGPFQWFIMTMGGLAWMADGMEMTLLAVLGPELSCQWRLSSQETATLTMVVFLGMSFFGIPWGNICDRYGRKFGLVLSTLVTFYFGALSAFSPSYAWLLAIRTLCGMGIAGAPQAVTIHAEFLPTEGRAVTLILVELFWAIGAMLAVIISMFVMPTLGWRYVVFLCSIPLFLFALLCYWLPESVRFEVLSGNKAAAEKTLKRLAKWNGHEMPEGELKIEVTESDRGNFWDMFAPDLRVTTCLLFVIWMIATFSYYGMVLSVTEIFKALKTNDGQCIDSVQSSGSEESCAAACSSLTQQDYMDTLFTTAAEIPGLFFTIAVVEVIGRKATLAVEFTLFSIFTYVSYICMDRFWLVVVLFTARAFATGAFQCAYVYTPEVYPTSIRAISLGTFSTAGRVGAMITPFVAQVLLQTNIQLAMGIYAGCGILAAICSILLPYETKGRAMEAIAH